MNKEENHEIYKIKSKFLGASDIVNGTASLYEIREKEMDSAIKRTLKTIDEKPFV